MASGDHQDERDHGGERPTLKRMLINARNEYPVGTHQFMVPLCAQGRIITVDAIIESIAPPGPARPPDLEQSARNIYNKAKLLFAILALMEKETDIHKLLKEGICDKDLPFKRIWVDHGHSSLHRNSGRIVLTCEKWPDDIREKFDREQFWMFSPFFEDMEHYVLEQNIVLPYIHDASLDMEKYKRKEGGYGVVFPVRLHSSHHSFPSLTRNPNQAPLIAIKKLFSNDEKEFEREVKVLKEIANRKHPHMIQLLATYQHKDEYYLMFPFAQSNLRRYWKDRPNPKFNYATLVWNLKQMSGVANALLCVHNYEVTIEPGEADEQKGVRLSVQPEEKKYGRHGDIKPENFLWFQGINGDPDGALQLADFGLGRFHRESSRSRTKANDVPRSPTYEPPECRLLKLVSRGYDFWSLGCVFLEYLTWLLMGDKAITEFSDARGRGKNIDDDIDDDNYFDIDDNGDDAVVRQEVVEWVEDLHAHPKASALVHELLNLTMGQLLVVDSKKRADATLLDQKLIALLKKANTSKSFVTKAIPYPKPHRETPKSHRKASKSTHSMKSVRFAERSISHSHTRSLTAP